MKTQKNLLDLAFKRSPVVTLTHESQPPGLRGPEVNRLEEH